MNPPAAMTPELIAKTRYACEDFEADLSAFVDGELSKLDAHRVSSHVDGCEGCASFVDSLTHMSRMNRHLDAEAALGEFEVGTLWTDLTRRLLEDSETRLADVLYELGKALMVDGVKRSSGMPFHHTQLTPPGSIPHLTRKGKKLVREHALLQSRSNRRARVDLDRRGLFPRLQRPATSAALECGRECMETVLKLTPARQEARIYLGFYLRLMERLTEARRQFRIVMRASTDRRLQLMAALHLSRIHVHTEDWPKALETQEKLIEETAREGHELMTVVGLTNAVIYLVHLGRLDRAEELIRRLVSEHADHLESTVVPILRKARQFQRLLIQQRAFLTRVRRRYPTLFAGVVES